jgi:Domain of unknown function (DUF4337)
MNTNLQGKKDDNEQVMVSAASERAEALSGILIAFFAAMMAISDLVNNNVEEEMQKAQSNHGSYFSWYQSKSVKQSLQESQLSTLETLVKTGVVKPEKTAAIDEEIDKIKKDIKRYKAEKKEIMEGSSSLKKEDWVQDLDGEMGKIVGVKEWEKMHDKLDTATNKFDVGMLFFQISLVLGAICVVIYDNPKLQRAFILMMVSTGVLGVIFSIWGYLLSI